MVGNVQMKTLTNVQQAIILALSIKPMTAFDIKSELGLDKDYRISEDIKPLLTDGLLDRRAVGKHPYYKNNNVYEYRINPQVISRKSITPNSVILGYTQTIRLEIE
jgi:hypothetical protein